MDWFTTAEIIEPDDKGWTVKAEVYGDEMDIWLRGQVDIIDYPYYFILEPEEGNLFRIVKKTESKTVGGYRSLQKKTI